jgi:hypothetical protein
MVGSINEAVDEVFHRRLERKLAGHEPNHPPGRYIDQLAPGRPGRATGVAWRHWLW